MLLSIPARNIDIPASSPNIPGGDFYVPTRIFKAQPGNERLPTIIVGTGYDGSQEDLYHEIGVEILERGWNIITYEGPGQPTVLKDQKLRFIPDWWNAVSPIIDYLETREDVDSDHIGLVGVSFGGQLAASREHRLSALICVDGMNDLYGHFVDGYSTAFTNLYNNGDYAKFDDEIWELEFNSTKTWLRWALAQSLVSFNTTSPSDWWSRLPEFTANSTMLTNISCPIT